MLFADQLDPATVALYTAIAGFFVVVTTILQTWYQQWQQQLTASRLEKKVDDRTAILEKKVEEKTTADERAHKEVKEETGKIAAGVEEVKAGLNGKGVAGTLKLMMESLTDTVAWQDQHETKDMGRHEELLGKINKLQEAKDKQ